MAVAETKPFRAVLGDCFAILPAPVRRLRGLGEAVRSAGRVEVRVEREISEALPRIDRLESSDKARICLEIDVAFPFLGTVLRYNEWLKQVPNVRDHG